MSKVSVLLPVYNGLPFLDEAIESIPVQTVTDIELLIIDDGSTDGSLLMALRIPRRLSKVRFTFAWRFFQRCRAALKAGAP